MTGRAGEVRQTSAKPAAAKVERVPWYSSLETRRSPGATSTG